MGASRVQGGKLNTAHCVAPRFAPQGKKPSWRLSWWRLLLPGQCHSQGSLLAPSKTWWVGGWVGLVLSPALGVLLGLGCLSAERRGATCLDLWPLRIANLAFTPIIDLVVRHRQRWLLKRWSLVRAAWEMQVYQQQLNLKDCVNSSRTVSLHLLMPQITLTHSTEHLACTPPLDNPSGAAAVPPRQAMQRSSLLRCKTPSSSAQSQWASSQCRARWGCPVRNTTPLTKSLRALWKRAACPGPATMRPLRVARRETEHKYRVWGSTKRSFWLGGPYRKIVWPVKLHCVSQRQ